MTEEGDRAGAHPVAWPRSGSGWRSSLADARRRLAEPEADRAQYLLRHGTMRIGVYAPRIDDQTPHVQDEAYIVIAGTAEFLRDDDRHPVSAGDVLFVPAGMAHRFDLPSADFATWVFFWGPEGGE